jgi:hypothetical protein
VHGEAADDLADLHRLADHNHEYAEDEKAGQLEHAPMRELALEGDGEHADRGDSGRAERRALVDAGRSSTPGGRTS